MQQRAKGNTMTEMIHKTEFGGLLGSLEDGGGYSGDERGVEFMYKKNGH